TKGIEYIAILIFFAVMVPFFILLNRRVKHRRDIRKALGILSTEILNIPQGIFFTRNHTWAHLERSGAARIGVSDLLLHVTGEVDVKVLRSPGEQVRKGEPLAEIGRDGKQLRILAPVTGEILNTNPLLHEDSSVMNEEPYKQGWLVKVRPTDWVGETQGYYLAENASRWTRQELTKFKDFMVNAVGALSPEPSGIILQDGGEIRDHCLADLPAESWSAFGEQFLREV
ncbi:MAG: glycine cleavage system protein H, partial [Bacteroidales bacterium]